MWYLRWSLLRSEVYKSSDWPVLSIQTYHGWPTWLFFCWMPTTQAANVVEKWFASSEAAKLTHWLMDTSFLLLQTNILKAGCLLESTGVALAYAEFGEKEISISSRILFKKRKFLTHNICSPRMISLLTVLHYCRTFGVGSEQWIVSWKTLLVLSSFLDSKKFGNGIIRIPTTVWPTQSDSGECPGRMQFPMTQSKIRRSIPSVHSEHPYYLGGEESQRERRNTAFLRLDLIQNPVHLIMWDRLPFIDMPNISCLYLLSQAFPSRLR